MDHGFAGGAGEGFVEDQEEGGAQGEGHREELEEHEEADAGGEEGFPVPAEMGGEGAVEVVNGAGEAGGSAEGRGDAGEEAVGAEELVAEGERIIPLGGGKNDQGGGDAGAGREEGLEDFL